VCALPFSSRSIAGVPSSRSLPVFPPHHMCAFLIDGCVAMKQPKKNGNLGDSSKSNLIKLKVFDKRFRKQIPFVVLRVSVFSLVLFLKSRAMSFDRKLYPIHGSRYCDRDLPRDCFAYFKSNNYLSNGNVAVPGIFIHSGGKQGGNYLEWQSRKKGLIP